MKNNFNECLQRLLKDEGGYSNNPNDNGGPTNYGITLTDYRKYINKAGTASDVKGMTVAQASTIYRTKYWNALACDSLPNGVDYTCFDYGVHSGLGRPRNALQKFKALTGDKLIDAINDERTTFLKRIGGGHNASFLKGWLARVARVRAYSHTLAKKTDVVSGPVAGAAAGGGLMYSMWEHVVAHPYFSTLAVLGVSAFIWWVVHSIRNQNVSN